MAKMTSAELASKALNIANNYKTSYIWGGLGSPITEVTLQQAINDYAVNKGYAASARRYLGHENAFFFDCVGLIKSILWEWNGNPNHNRGGAKWASNNVPDINADTMINRCSGVSTDFSNVQIGEALWCQGHIGIYIGDGLGVECTPIWANGVQVTAVGNICSKVGYNTRTWTKHGKLPYVNYNAAPSTGSSTAKKKTVDEIAAEVIAGKWGNGQTRVNRLKAAGYDPEKVQDAVNARYSGTAKKTAEEIAKEVIAGKWGNGTTRTKKLKAAGYDPEKIQKKVNELYE